MLGKMKKKNRKNNKVDSEDVNNKNKNLTASAEETNQNMAASTIAVDAAEQQQQKKKDTSSSSSSRMPSEQQNTATTTNSTVQELRPPRRTTTTSNQQQQQNNIIASSRKETILISNSGDVITCRCRYTPYHTNNNNHSKGSNRLYQWKDDIAVLCCDAENCDDLSANIQADVTNHLCSPWSSSTNTNAADKNKSNKKGGGLRGGSPAQVAPCSPPSKHPASAANTNSSPLHHHHHHPHAGSSSPNNTSNTSNSSSKLPRDPSSSMAQKAFRTLPIQFPAGGAEGYDEDASIVPIQSFDYSHFQEGGNDMVPVAIPPHPEKNSVQQYFHGVPTFCPAFLNIKINNVSAHPLGSHVLLVSHNGLLYSYGCNGYGQLGIGMKHDVFQPTIVTPLVENGGKAISCAAGVDYSLVVIETEERRLVRSRSRPSSSTSSSAATSSSLSGIARSQTIDTSESTVHQQLYGFGRNDFMKIGLVNGNHHHLVNDTKDDDDCIVLPRRVALRCSVHGPGQGIISVRASCEHSAALVQRPSGDVELYTWGHASAGALGVLPTTKAVGFPPQQQQSFPAAAAPLPSSSSSKKTKKQQQQPDEDVADAVVNVMAVPSILASLSRSSNPEAQALSLLLEDEYPTDIALGPHCSLVVTSWGRCFSFGRSDEGMLALGSDATEAHQPTEIVTPEPLESISAGASHVLARSQHHTGHVYGWGMGSYVGIPNKKQQPEQQVSSLSDQKNKDTSKVQPPPPPPTILWSPTRIDLPEATSIIQAGYDCSFFVTESGQVYSAGKNSGRLGLGEIVDKEETVETPQPLFGGLHLWMNPELPLSYTQLPLSSIKKKRLLKRGETLG